MRLTVDEIEKITRDVYLRVTGVGIIKDDSKPEGYMNPTVQGDYIVSSDVYEYLLTKIPKKED